MPRPGEIVSWTTTVSVTESFLVPME